MSIDTPWWFKLRQWDKFHHAESTVRRPTEHTAFLRMAAAALHYKRTGIYDPDVVDHEDFTEQGDETQ